MPMFAVRTRSEQGRGTLRCYKTLNTSQHKTLELSTSHRRHFTLGEGSTRGPLRAVKLCEGLLTALLNTLPGARSPPALAPAGRGRGRSGGSAPSPPRPPAAPWPPPRPSPSAAAGTWPAPARSPPPPPRCEAAPGSAGTAVKSGLQNTEGRQC